MKKMAPVIMTALVAAGVVGVVGVAMGKMHPFSPPPTMTIGKFVPDPVEVGNETIAKLKGKATAPTKMEDQSQATLTWAWKIDRVQYKPQHADSFATAQVGTYDASISGGGGSDPHAIVTLRPKRVGDWKVAVHGIATFTDKTGDTWIGETEQHEATVMAQTGSATQPG
jgi:hypothetical protein